VLAASAVSAEPPPAAPARRAEARTEPRTTRRAEKQAAAAPRTTSRPTAPATQVLPAPPPPAPAPSPTTPVLPAAAAAPSQPAVIEDAPRYAAEGFRRPQLAEPQCVQHSIRAPRDIASRVDGPVTIRFAVGPDGSISLFQIMGDVPDPRLPDMLESAVRSCTFLPGADAQGRPVRMWVTMPIRFAR
jgi:TonB family protein